MDTPGLSLCMIVKDEAQHLENCLLSVQGIVSEIIIADTGSTDGSIEIARRFGARVIEVPWEHDFSKARNVTLCAASSPWILVLDADEVLADWKTEEVNLLLEAAEAWGYFLPFIHYVGGTGGEDYVTDHVCRLFRNDERIHFRGSIHEEAASSIWALPEGHIAYAGLPVHHYGYLDGELQRKDKASRNLKLIRAALKHDPDNIQLKYALGTEYYQQEQYGAAAGVLLPLLNQVPAGSGYTADLYLKTAYALQSAGKPEEAIAVYEAGRILYADFTDLLESYAGLLEEQGNYPQAYELLQAALLSGDAARRYPSSSGSGTSRTRCSAGQLCEKLFLYEEAAGHYEQAIRCRPGSPAAWEQLAALCLLGGQEERLTVFTRQLLPSLSPDLLSRLVPAALNARAAGWLAALCAAPHLPEAVRQVLQVLLGTLFRQPEQPCTAAVQLERLLPGAPEQPWLSGYLWALSCRSGDTAAAGLWLERLAPHRHGLSAVHRCLAEPAGGAPVSPAAQQPETALPDGYPAGSRKQAGSGPACQPPQGSRLSPDALTPASGCLNARTNGQTGADAACPLLQNMTGAEQSAEQPLSFPDLSYAAQLLAQAGAWDNLLLLHSLTGTTHFRWSRLPQPLLHGLLHAPAPFRIQWCAMYDRQAHDYISPGDAAEWLLYAALSTSCGLMPQLTPADEHTLRQSGGTAAAIGISYHNLLLAAEAFPQRQLTAPVAGNIPWLLLVRSALQEARQHRSI
ncbi:glycosyltransferase [Paenibacillus sp. MMS20-IR301]|uniref:tetratricopeptide repeat-containing glycosyltransferase family 2 protein n=1 Tax=Paenibacillus sp. MMS20-IR301 TaxID=2895946 RepID=UPI0028EF149D|nr:glycosyltransferase [Paenibacillus sp. MMS20-IR301]WNS43218.1 glycosyltransferase [Paenibacillus sp. MMS20-IR301]